MPGDVFRDGRFQADTWSFPTDDQPLPQSGQVAVGRTRFLAEIQTLRARNDAIGVVLAPGESLDGVADHLDRIALVTLRFAKYSDGRPYSVARILRDRYGYNRVLYVMVAAACSSIPVDKTAPADPQRVWDETCRRFAEDGMLWDSQAQIDPPYTGVGKSRRRGVSLLSAPTVLR